MSDQATLEILIAIRSDLADLNKLNQGIAQITEKSTGMGQALKTGLGIGSGMAMATQAISLLKSTFVDTVKEAFSLADEIRKQSQALGLSTDAYQMLRHEFLEAGADLGHLGMALTQQTRSMEEARKGVGAAADAYRTLGLNAAQLEQLSPEVRLQMIVNALGNATDKTRAFQAVGQILGSRGLPLLLAALKNVATEGAGKLEDSLKSLGQIMDKEVVDRLAAAEIRWKNLWHNVVIETADGLVGIDNLIKTAQKAPGATFWGLLQGAVTGNFGALGATMAANLPAPKPEPDKKETPPSPVPQEEALKAHLLALQQQYDLASNDGLKTETQKRSDLLNILGLTLETQQALLHTLYDGIDVNQNEATLTEAQLTQLKLKRQLLADIAKTKQTAAQVAGDQPSAYERIRDTFQFRENRMRNPDYLTMGEGMKAGVMNWADALGSRGQQVAAMLQNTIGTAVSGISQGITGWIMGTQKWADSLRQIGSSILQTVIQAIIQMGVQWVATQIMMAVVGKALVSSTTLALKPIAATQAAIWTPAATLATIASYGGAAAAAPWEIMSSIGLTEGITAGLSGAKEGGFFPGQDDEVAGAFHGNEFIFSAPAVRKLGAQNLGALHSAALGSGASGSASGGSSKPLRFIHVYPPDAFSAKQLARDTQFENVIVDVMRRRRGEILES